MEKGNRIIIGNPGVGKSTLLNSVAGEIVFASGWSSGKGKTRKLVQSKIGSITYSDTPGMGSTEAGEEISKVLKQGGPCQILFAVTEEYGRVRPQDVATMKVVLNAAPEIKNNFGIIVNKCTKKQIAYHREESNWLMFVTKLFHGIDVENQHMNILLLERCESLEDETNALVTMDKISHLEEFMNTRLPVVDLTPDAAKDIDTNALAGLKEEMESKIKELEEDSEAMSREAELMKPRMEEERAPKYIGGILGSIFNTAGAIASQF